MTEEERVQQERLFYVISKLLNNALLGVPRQWLEEQRALADASFACDLDHLYICLTGVSRESYTLSRESETNYFDSEYRIKDFLAELMNRHHCRYEFFYHNVTKEQVILFTLGTDRCNPQHIAAAIHEFVDREMRETMPRLYEQVGVLTVLSDYIEAYEQLGPAFEHLQMLKSCAFFHRESALFTDELLNSLRIPLSLDKARSLVNELERFALGQKREEALAALDTLLLQDVKHCFDLRRAEEVCVLLRLLLQRWQSAYGFRLEESRIAALTCGQHLTVESLCECARQLFCEALSNLSGTKKPLHPLTQELLDILHYQFAQPLTLAEIARRLHVSPEHLSRVFKQDMGVCFSDYLLQVRMKEALRLLRETKLSVIEVAQKAGFADANYFHRIFHRQTGMTPVQYRQGK